MKITIQILGLPDLSQALGTRETEVDVPGRTVTVQHALDHLVQHFGPPVRKALYDRQESLNPMIQIALNGKTFIPSDSLDTSLREGDILIFMLLMAGGASEVSGLEI
jgi:molybdopterin converting factor small subunit